MRSPGESDEHERPDVIRAEPELRDERPRSDRREAGPSRHLVEERRIACIRRPVLPDRSDHRAPADAAGACNESDLAEEHRQQGRLPGAVRPCDREPLTGCEVEVDRARGETRRAARPHP